MHMYRIQYYVYACMDAKDVATIEATEAAASVINSASYILKYTTTFTVLRACHDKFVCSISKIARRMSLSEMM